MSNPPPELQSAYFRSGALISIRDIAEIKGHLYRVDRIVLHNSESRYPEGWVDFVPMAGAPDDISYSLNELTDMQRAKEFKLYTYNAIC